MDNTQPKTTQPTNPPVVVRTPTVQFKSGKVKFALVKKQLPSN